MSGPTAVGVRLDEASFLYNLARNGNGDTAHIETYRRALRVAAMEYTHEILKEIRLLDHGEFQRTLDNLLGTIIASAKHPKVVLP